MCSLPDKILFFRIIIFFFACIIFYLCDRASRLGRRNEWRGLWHGEGPHCCQPSTVLWQSRKRGVAALLERCRRQTRRSGDIFSGPAVGRRASQTLLAVRHLLTMNVSVAVFPVMFFAKAIFLNISAKYDCDLQVLPLNSAKRRSRNFRKIWSRKNFRNIYGTQFS